MMSQEVEYDGQLSRMIHYKHWLMFMTICDHEHLSKINLNQKNPI